MPIEWREKLSVGDPTIDEDHKSLVHLINQYEAAIEKRDASLLRNTFKGLADYAASHFEREERLMEAVYFPERRAHREKHADLMIQVKEFHQRILKGERISIVETSRFLHNWFVDHVIQEDLKLGNFILGRPRM